MSYDIKRPVVGEIIVVPLAHPGGVYIRRTDNSKIPILAKVRSIFSDTVNVINFFGYVYNVPIIHTQKIDFSANTQFYIELIEDASRIMASLGYQAKDNSEFYNISQNPVSYTFLTHLPGYDSFVISPDLTVYGIDNRIDTMTGLIHVMDINKKGLLHFVNKIIKDIIFDESTGELLIKGYGAFFIDSWYSYGFDASSSYVIFKSQRNYIHVKKNNIAFRKIIKQDRLNNTYHIVKTIRPDPHNPDDKFYYDIITIINNVRF
jgi:hypothetical protein